MYGMGYGGEKKSNNCSFLWGIGSMSTSVWGKSLFLPHPHSSAALYPSPCWVLGLYRHFFVSKNCSRPLAVALVILLSGSGRKILYCIFTLGGVLSGMRVMFDDIV